MPKAGVLHKKVWSSLEAAAEVAVETGFIVDPDVLSTVLELRAMRNGDEVLYYHLGQKETYHVQLSDMQANKVHPVYNYAARLTLGRFVPPPENSSIFQWTLLGWRRIVLTNQHEGGKV
jgi:hypothetical protein